MAQIFIVNHAISGPYTQCFSTYHHTEEEGQEFYDWCMESASEDPNMIELIRLDTETLVKTTIHHWEGNLDDLEGERDYEDDGIVEGSP